jgi:2-methylcitrate dehydratase PrpD
VSSPLNTPSLISQHMTALADFVRTSSTRELPEEVAWKGKLHLLDTMAAIISGTKLPPGELAINFARAQNGLGNASILGTSLRVPTVTAAFANGMLGHADETDDSHAASLTHPGCAVVPSALAHAEVYERSGDALLKAVVTGYEAGARINMALGPRALINRGHGPHSIGGHWGAGAAAGALSDFTDEQMRFLLSYVAQQTAGVACWMRDQSHVLKAFVFGGMPSRNGSFAAEMVANGFTGIPDVLEGRGNFLFAYSENPQPHIISDKLGEDYAVSTAAIKKWSVGSPIQAPLDSLLAIITEHGITHEQVMQVRALVPDNAAHVVDNREMPDINLQHCLALMLIDGTLTFASSHDHERMHDPLVMEVKTLIELVPDADLSVAVPARQGIIEIETKDGRVLRHRTVAVRGTPSNPMTEDEVISKARDLLLPILGSGRAEGLIETVMRIEKLDNVALLRKLWE